MYHALVRQADLEQHTPKGKYTERKRDMAGNGAITLMDAYSEHAGNEADDCRLVLCFCSPFSARNGAELLECPMKSEFRLEVEQSDLTGW